MDSSHNVACCVGQWHWKDILDHFSVALLDSVLARLLRRGNCLLSDMLPAWGFVS